MKRYLFIFAILLIGFSKSKAQNFSLSNFTIPSGYLQNGKLNVTNSSAATPFSFELIMTRGGVSTGGFQTDNCIVTLIYTESQSVILETNDANGNTNNYESDPSTIELSTPRTISSSDYNNTAFAYFLGSNDLDATLPAGKQNGKILLRYKFYDRFVGVNVTRYSTTRYNINIATSPGGGTGQPPISTPPVPGSVPLYEFYSSSLNDHFYTVDYNNNNWIGYTYSRIVGYVFTSQQSGTVPLYKYTGFGHLLYTTDGSVSTPGYNLIGAACYVYASQISKTFPVYEHIASNNDHYYFDGPGTFEGYTLQNIKFYVLQNQQTTTYPLPEEDTAELYEYFSTSGDHFYTTLKKDRPGYTYIKVLGYVHTIQKPGTIPLYRYYSASSPARDHYYTTVQQNYGSYIYEGIVGYVYNNGNTAGTTPIHEYYTSINGDHYYNTVNSTPSGYGYYGIPFYMLQYNH